MFLLWHRHISIVTSTCNNHILHCDVTLGRNLQLLYPDFRKTWDNVLVITTHVEQYSTTYPLFTFTYYVIVWPLPHPPLYIWSEVIDPSPRRMGVNRALVHYPQQNTIFIQSWYRIPIFPLISTVYMFDIRYVGREFSQLDKLKKKVPHPIRTKC